MAYQRNDVVTRLLLHAYGQASTVALPTPLQAAADIGRFPAGVNDALTHLMDAYVDWRQRNEIHWCFLVGGPGNGKSEALRALAGVLNVALPERGTGDPAPRTVPLEWPDSALPVHDGLQIAFINDASIPRQECLAADSSTSLYKDIVDGISRLNLEQPAALFGNVNRGILVEELAACESKRNPQDSDVGRIARCILDWLAKPERVLPAAGFTVSYLPSPATKYYSQALIGIGGRQLVIHAVFLDTLSLLEPAPGGTSSINFSTRPPTVAEYRPTGSLDHTQGSREATVAGERTAFWTQPSFWEEGNCSSGGRVCDAHSLCPFANNARWLRGPVLRNQFLSTLRGLEVVAGRRLSYRDLLAHLSLAIIGPAEEHWLNGLHPCQWVEERHRTPDGDNLAQLVHHRVYANLFPKPSADTWRRISKPARSGRTVYGAIRRRFVDVADPDTSPFQRSLARMDPARDAESWKTLRMRVLDICDAADVELPARQLQGVQEIPSDAHSDLEEMLDQLTSSEIATELASGSSDGTDRVRLLRKWRGLLLLRQAGLATGNCTFRDTIDAWLKEHSDAINGLPGSQLQVGLTNLILPPVPLSAGQQHILILPFRPRTYALRNLPPPGSAFVAIPHSNLRVSMVADGDKLTAELAMVGPTEVKRIAEVVVDFAIAREGLIQATGDFKGFTEIGYGAFARIERARAALVGRKRAQSLLLHIVAAKGDHYHVEPSATGTPPLRIVR